MAHTALLSIGEALRLDDGDLSALLGSGLLELEKIRKEPETRASRERLIRIRCVVEIYRYLMKQNDRDPPECSRVLRSRRDGAPFYNQSALTHMKTGLRELVESCKYFTSTTPTPRKRLAAGTFSVNGRT
jgi:hypothetical protein